jgi:hypothetical protein
VNLIGKLFGVKESPREKKPAGQSPPAFDGAVFYRWPHCSTVKRLTEDGVMLLELGEVDDECTKCGRMFSVKKNLMR